MRFVIPGEWSRNRLLQTIVVLYSVYVGLLWLTNGMLYFRDMGLTQSSVVAHYLGNTEEFRSPKSYSGMLELAHFHLFAMGMLLLVLTHLALFVRVGSRLKTALVIIPFTAGIFSEGAGWLVRFASPSFAVLKIVAFLVLQGSLAALVVTALWSVFCGGQAANYTDRSGIESGGGDGGAGGGERAEDLPDGGGLNGPSSLR